MPRLYTDLPLAPRTTFQLGGPARELIEAAGEDDIVGVLRERGDAPLLVLGGGSNMLVSDRGYDGAVLAIRGGGIAVERDGEAVRLTAQAGEPWQAVVDRAVGEGLAGVEALAGIPGLTGATPIQNVGAYGQEVSDTIERVRAFDRIAGEVVELAASDCAFAYRDSAFKSRWPGRHVVLAVTFRLRPGAPATPRYGELTSALGDAPLTLARIRDTVVELRRKKGMVVDASDPDSRGAGSFFTNPIIEPGDWAAVVARAAMALRPGETLPSFDAGHGRRKLAAAWLIERAGFVRGTSRPGAGQSSKHALALVNRGGTASDVVALAAEIQGAVRERFGVSLTPEPVLVGFPAGTLG